MRRNEAHELLVKALILALSKTGVCRVWEHPTGAAFRGKRMIHFGLVGSADISGILKGGRRLEIEVKTGSGRQTLEQKAFGEMITAMGGLHIVARDLNETVRKVLYAGSN